MTQALLLTGGQGTRLRALYPGLPKALVPVGDEPLLERQLAWLGQGGITHVHLAAGHLAEALDAWLAHRPGDDMHLALSTEPKPLGTGGAVRFCREHLGSAPFLVLNGDSLLPSLDFPGLLARHREGNAIATLAVAPIEKAGRYGTVLFDEQHRIHAFREKAEQRAGWVNGGVYVMSPGVLDEIPETTPSSLETDLFPRLAAAKRLAAYPCDPPLLDMGTAEGLEQMTAYLRAHP